MAEVDTSSYPRALPTKSLLDTAQQLGGMQQQAIQIDRQKLDLFNSKYDIINRQMAIHASDPNLTQDTLLTEAQNLVKRNVISPEDFANFAKTIPTDPAKVRQFAIEQLKKGQTTQDSVNWQFGQHGFDENGQQRTPTLTSSMPGFSPNGAVKPAGLPIQQQAGPITAVIGPGGVSQQLGAQNPQLPPNAVPAPNGLPGQFNPNAPIVPKPVRTLPVTAPTVAPNQVITPPVAAPGSPNERVSQGFTPRGPITGNPPMFEEGRKQLAADQELATQKLTAIKPAIQALPLLEGLRTGPTTETFNNVVATLKANNVIPTGLNDPTAIRQEVNKKLAQYVASSPIGQRSDAAQTLAEASSPSPSHQINQALVKLTKDAIVLDRVQAARAGAFEGNDYSKYGEHRSTFPARVDERAFGIDLMKPDERQKLLDEMYKKKDSFEGKKFWNSLGIVKKQGLIDIGG